MAHTTTTTKPEEEVTLKLVPTRKLWYDEETSHGGWAVKPNEEFLPYVKLNERFHNITIKGNTSNLFIGAEYNATIVPTHDKYGSYEIISIYQDLKDEDARRAFLTSVLGESKTKALYDAYPEQNIVDLIEKNQIDISKVRGVGEKTLSKLKDKLIENVEFQQAFGALKKYGFSNKLIIKMVKAYKNSEALLSQLNKNPYDITKIQGIGFLKADEVAVAMGMKENSPLRIQNAIRYCLLQNAQNGHTYMVIDSLLDTVNELIHVSYAEITEQLLKTKHIIQKKDRVSLKKYYDDEVFIADCLFGVLKGNKKLNIKLDDFIQQKEKDIGLTLTDEQKQILQYVVDYRAVVLTGAAGTGKSQTTRFIIEMLKRLDLTYTLVSPTAKAAKVLHGYTGEETMTIHRAIGLGIDKNDKATGIIESDVVLVDEVSMVNVSLMAQLLSVSKNENVRFIFVGDMYQLASIGAGRILQDLISSTVIPTVQLTKVFRQAEGGALDKATRIRNGEIFLRHTFVGIKKFGKDLTIACVPNKKIIAGYHYYYNQCLKKYDSNDITIISPTNKGDLGTIAINNEIQRIINPKAEDKAEYQTKRNGMSIVYRVGDRIINTKNEYHKYVDYDQPRVTITNEDGEDEERPNFVAVINGDQGTIVGIDKYSEEIYVSFEEHTVIIPFGDIRNFLLAYSISVHRMQGSSNKVIIFIADKSSIYMLSRNLLYTACTRETEQLIILTQSAVFNRGIKKKTDMLRHTWLKDLLIAENK